MTINAQGEFCWSFTDRKNSTIYQMVQNNNICLLFEESNNTYDPKSA